MNMMHAAVLHDYGKTPEYGCLPVPEPQTAGQVLIRLEAASIKQLDKLKASGRHYTRYLSFPVAVGVDGVGCLPDGRRVYAMGVTGMLAEYALANLDDCVPVPDHMPAGLAAVLPNALLGSDAALVCRAGIQAGQVVMINGATGVSGRMAVQVARLRGAGRIIVTGRNPQSLNELRALGADECISLLDAPQAVVQNLEQVQQRSPVDIVLDYLWGQPMQWILQAFSKDCPNPVKIITIGQMAGAEITLPSGILRSQPISLLGSGFGSINASQLHEYNQRYLPEMLSKAAAGEILADYQSFALADITQAWQAEVVPGSRVVVCP